MYNTAVTLTCIWPDCGVRFDTTTHNKLSLCPKHLKIHKAEYARDWRKNIHTRVAVVDRSHYGVPRSERAGCIEGGIKPCPICPVQKMCPWGQRVLVAKRFTRCA